MMRTRFGILVVVLVLVPAVTALAKGPASATLDGPGIDEPIRFLDQRRPVDSYEVSAPTDMLRLTALWHGPGATATEPPTDDPGSAYTVTWEMFGGTGGEPIVQYIYPDASEGGLIHTPEQKSLEGWGDGVTGWFEAPRGLSAAIEEIVEKGQNRQLPRWQLPSFFVMAVVGLVLWGRNKSPDSGSAGLHQLGE